MKRKMSKKEAIDYLYSLWENGICNSNFTEDHSEYEEAIEYLTKFGLSEFNYEFGHILK